MLRRIFACLYGLNNTFAESVAHVSSWRVWMTLVTVGPLIAILYDSLRNHGFNPTSAVMTFVILILTIQTSIDSQGQRLNQAELRHMDLKRDEQWWKSLESTSHLTIAIREELDRARERDDKAATRDIVLHGLIVKLLASIVRTQDEGGESVNGRDSLDQPRDSH